MRVVGIKQLKARLSEYLREVRRGETFLVTDRNEVVAELGPPGQGAPTEAGGLERALESLVREGQVTPPRLPKKGWSWKPAGAGLTAGTGAALIEDLRSDRTR